MILDGREVAGFIKERHRQQVAALGRAPKLVIVSSGQTAATQSFVHAKVRYGEGIGVAVEVLDVPSGELLEAIAAQNARDEVTGIIVQLPLGNPEQTDAALAAVEPAKDVDGLAPGSSFQVSAAKGIIWLLGAYSVEVKAQAVSVVGQGRLVGAPVADALESIGADVTRCNEHTADLAAATREADVIIAATGVPALITREMVKSGTAIVDAGSGSRDGRVVGDVDPELVGDRDLKVSPVPGGVGPMTVAALFDNLLIAAQAV